MTNRRMSRTKIKGAIPGSYGIVARVANRAGYSWRHTRDFILADPELADMMLQEEEIVDDVAESGLIGAMAGGNTDVMKWWLARRRTRYSDRIDVNQSGNQVITLKWNDEDKS